MTTPVDPLELIALTLDHAGLPWALIGGHAVNAWVEPRFTDDIDLTVAADPNALGRVSNELISKGYVIDREYGADQSSGPDFVRFTRGEHEPPIELQAAKTEFQNRILERAVQADGVSVATPEDLLVLKLIADRPKDQTDLLNLAALADLDWAYIKDRAEEWGVQERLSVLLPCR